MPSFQYVARNAQGQAVRSALDAVSRHDALARLRDQGLVVVDLVERDDPSRADALPGRARQKRQGPIISLEKRVSTSDKAIFCRQLAITVSAGMPLRESLESIAGDMDHPTFRRVLQAVVMRIHQGESFSQAIERHPKCFNPLFIALVRAAEESGSLPETLEQLAGYMERSERLAKKIKAITSYPIFIMVFFIIVCIVMTLFVLPKFMESMRGLDVELPRLTSIVFGFNEFVLDRWVWFLSGIILPILGIGLYRRTPAGKRRIDAIVLKLPLFGVCIRQSALARFCRNLAIMLRGGVGVTVAMDITSAVSDNQVIIESLQHAKDRIMNGERIAASLAQDKEIPRLVIRMIGVGEESGRLPEVLDKVAMLYEEYVENKIIAATSLFEPIVICLFGAVVLVLVMAIYLPIFTVSQGVK